MIKETCATVAAVLLLGGCSSSSGGRKGTTAAAPRSPSSSAFTASPSDDAATLAAHIPGCTGPATGDVGQGAPAMTSTATCTLEGHLVIIDGWATAADAQISGELTGDRHVSYAYGNNWTAFLADQGATAATTTLQMQLTNQAGALLGQQMNSDAPAPVPAATQAALTARIAQALGGSTATS